MSEIDKLQKEHEERLSTLVTELSGKGGPSDEALVRALIHRAVHLAAERKSVEFCGLATYLAEMVGHAHQLQHGGKSDPKAHDDFVH